MADLKKKAKKNKDVETKISEPKNSEIKELKDTIQRLQADFENYKKQVEKQNLEVFKRTKADLINRLLPTLDSFELAFKNDNKFEEFKKGIELIYSQFFQILEDLGVRPIDCNGKFDPYKHEVLLSQESDKEEGLILEELQKGYMLEDCVLRHSKVKVVKKKICGDKDGK
jgi:molecular chaperone GrpE